MTRFWAPRREIVFHHFFVLNYFFVLHYFFSATANPSRIGRIVV